MLELLSPAGHDGQLAHAAYALALTGQLASALGIAHARTQIAYKHNTPKLLVQNVDSEAILIRFIRRIPYFKRKIASESKSTENEGILFIFPVYSDKIR